MRLASRARLPASHRRSARALARRGRPGHARTLRREISQHWGNLHVVHRCPLSLHRPSAPRQGVARRGRRESKSPAGGTCSKQTPYPRYMKSTNLQGELFEVRTVTTTDLSRTLQSNGRRWVRDPQGPARSCRRHAGPFDSCQTSSKGPAHHALYSLSTVRGGQISSHRPRVVVPHSTCPPTGSGSHAGWSSGGVGPERGLRGGGRGGWCEEWARRG